MWLIRCQLIESYPVIVFPVSNTITLITYTMARMTRRTLTIILAHLAWVGIGLFWFVVTRDFHPTIDLAVIVTTSLVIAFAIAADVNHFLLIPWFWRSQRFVLYAMSLFGTMAGVTAIALAIIRISYFQLYGPDADPYGAYKHFAIDLFGTTVHVALAAGIVWLWGRVTRNRISQTSCVD